MTAWWRVPAWAEGTPLPIVVKTRQSNCGGQSDMPTTPDETVPRADILTYHLRINISPWLISVDPLHYRPLDVDDGLFPGVPPTGRLSAGGEVEMGVRLADVHQRPCAICTVWKGATGYTDWRPDLKTGLTSQSFDAIDVFIDRLADLGFRAYVCAVVFTGGEAEASITEQAAVMQDIIEEEIARWRGRYGAGLPFVIDQLRSDIDRNATLLGNVRAGLAAAVAADPLTRLVDTSTCELKDDDVHYTPDGLAAKAVLDADAIVDMAAYAPTEETHVRAARYTSEALAREVARAFGGSVRKAPIDDLWYAATPIGKHWIPRAWETV